MNKRLRKKMVKLGRLKPISSLLLKPGSYFLGEKKIIEHYTLLKSLQPEHPLLALGQIRDDGRFRFTSSFVEHAPEHLKMVQIQQGIPETHHPTLHYIDSLMNASIEHGALKKRL